MTEPDGSSTSVLHTQVMPLSNHTSMVSMLSTRPNTSNWAHVFSRQYGQHAIIHVHHCRINDTEEGDDNGRLHQLRGYHSSVNNLTERAEESDSNGIIMDYLWDDGDQKVFNDYAATESVNTVADAAAEALQDAFNDGGANDVIATCASMMEEEDNDEIGEDENHGIMAFGWNNQPFEFNGRAGSWVNGCFP